MKTVVGSHFSEQGGRPLVYRGVSRGPRFVGVPAIAGRHASGGQRGDA
jgi:hypothetical protein